MHTDEAARIVALIDESDEQIQLVRHSAAIARHIAAAGRHTAPAD